MLGTPPPKRKRTSQSSPSPSSVSAYATSPTSPPDRPLSELPVDFDLGSLPPPEPSTADTDERVAIAMRISAMVDHVGLAGAERFLEHCSRYCDWAQVDRDAWCELSDAFDGASPEQRSVLMRVVRAVVAQE